MCIHVRMCVCMCMCVCVCMCVCLCLCVCVVDIVQGYMYYASQFAWCVVWLSINNMSTVLN